MANISHFTQTVNGVSTTYDIHDANAIPRSGGAVMTGTEFARTTTDSRLVFRGGTNNLTGASLVLYGKDSSTNAGTVTLLSYDGTNDTALTIRSTDKSAIFSGTLFRPETNNECDIGSSTYTFSNLYIYKITLKNSCIVRTVSNDYAGYCGGTSISTGGGFLAYGKDSTTNAGGFKVRANNGSVTKEIQGWANGTLTWDGTPIQTSSDQRLKQQITEIDNKLLDAWEDVEPSQFKYNDAVDQKGKDKARLHTGYVVQQINSACKSHGVDISAYGLYCHEEYPQETEEVEVEQADGTKVKETKVIREANEHYSLRYTEVYAVECMYLRRCIARLTARIEQLEKDKEQEAGK